jgi:hypothetical protein
MKTDQEFDVYVTEGALAFVHRGKHISRAQMFGVDWDGPSHSVMHASVFEAPTPSRPAARAPNAPRRSAGRDLLDRIFPAPVV